MSGADLYPLSVTTHRKPFIGPRQRCRRSDKEVCQRESWRYSLLRWQSTTGGLPPTRPTSSSSSAAAAVAIPPWERDSRLLLLLLFLPFIPILDDHQPDQGPSEGHPGLQGFSPLQWINSLLPNPHWKNVLEKLWLRMFNQPFSVMFSFEPLHYGKSHFYFLIHKILLSKNLKK